MNKMPEINKNYENMPSLGKMHIGGGPQRFAIKEKPKNARGTLLRLLRMLMRWRAPLIAAVFLTVLSSAIAVSTPLLLGKAVNTLNINTREADWSLLTVILTALAACYLSGWLIDLVNGVLMAKLTQTLVKYLRAEFFAKLQKIPLNFYDTRPHGDTMSRLTNDVDNISTTVAQTTTQLIASVCTVAGSFVMMLLLSPLMTLAALVSIPLFLLLTKTIAGRSKQFFIGQQRMLGELGGIIEENIVGLKMVKAFRRQEKVLADFEKTNGELCEYATKAQIWSGLMMPFMNVINNLGYALISCAGGVLSVNGMVSVGTVVSFLAYSRQFGQPLNNIAGMFNNIQSALAGAERIFEILDEAEELPDGERAVRLTAPKGKVEFSGVWFSYRPGVPVLKGISFAVEPGRTVALVGETGAGKTTIVNLLTRFYELDEGSILIDDTDIRDIARKSLRECFSVVLQDTCLFSGTIYDNIRYSKPSATDAQVREAARQARADGFISRLPKGYETIVTGSADNLSQGQRQLISIARAILCGAPILILDEATNSVDTKTEKEIQRAMLSLMKGRTCFFIAHRLSTIRDADTIMVIGDGEILERGTHGELMGKRGRYYDMVVSQMGLDA